MKDFAAKDDHPVVRGIVDGGVAIPRRRRTSRAVGDQGGVETISVRRTVQDHSICIPEYRGYGEPSKDNHGVRRLVVHGRVSRDSDIGASSIGSSKVGAPGGRSKRTGQGLRGVAARGNAAGQSWQGRAEWLRIK